MGWPSFKRSARLLLYFSKGAISDRERTEQTPWYWSCEVSLQRPAQSLRDSTVNTSGEVGSGNWMSGDTQLQGGAPQPLLRDTLGIEDKRGHPLCNHWPALCASPSQGTVSTGSAVLTDFLLVVRMTQQRCSFSTETL